MSTNNPSEEKDYILVEVDHKPTFVEIPYALGQELSKLPKSERLKVLMDQFPDLNLTEITCG